MLFRSLPESLPVNLDQKHIEALKEIFGEADVSTAVKDRVSVAYGKTMYDAYRLREGILENIADVVVYPSSHDQIVKLVTYANEHKIPLYVYGGGSSVTRGVESIQLVRQRTNRFIQLGDLERLPKLVVGSAWFGAVDRKSVV